MGHVQNHSGLGCGHSQLDHAPSAPPPQKALQDTQQHSLVAEMYHYQEVARCVGQTSNHVSSPSWLDEPIELPPTRAVLAPKQALYIMKARRASSP